MSSEVKLKLSEVKGNGGILSVMIKGLKVEGSEK